MPVVFDTLTASHLLNELLQILDYYIREAKMIVFHNFAFDAMALRKEGIEI